MSIRKAFVIIGLSAITLLMGCKDHVRRVFQDDASLYEGATLSVYQDSYDGQRTSLELGFNDTVSDRCITTIYQYFDTVVFAREGNSWHVPVDVTTLGAGEDLFLRIHVYFHRDTTWYYAPIEYWYH